MLGVIEGKEVDGEGAQSLQNIWLEGESDNTPGKAGTASPGIPNISTISMASSNTTEVVDIEFVASEEQTFKVTGGFGARIWAEWGENSFYYHTPTVPGRRAGSSQLTLLVEP